LVDQETDQNHMDGTDVVGYYKAKQKVHATSLFSIYFLKGHLIMSNYQTHH